MPADYTLLDATLEILLMLLAAFLLGWLFCWLMKKLFVPKQNNTIEAPDLNLQANRPERTGLSASSRERLYDPEVGIPRPEADVNIDADIPTINEPTIKSVELKTPRPRIDIPDLKTPDINLPDLDIKGKVDAGLDIGKGLGAAGIGAIAVGASSLKNKAIDTIDNIDLSLDKPDVDIESPSLEAPEIDLPDIPEIEASANLDLPEVERVKRDIELPDVDLPDLSADTHSPDVDLSNLDADINLPEVELPDLTTDIELPDIEPSELSSQDLETEIDLPNLDLPATEIDLNLPESSVTPDTTLDNEKGLISKGLGAAAAGIGTVATGASNLKEKATDKVEEIGDSLTRPDLPEYRKSSLASNPKVTKRSSEDNLTRINGIDEPIATLLNSKGVETYAQLRDSDRSTLRAYLDESGIDNFKKVEPASWPHQAKLCADKNWVKLSEYQAFLAGQSTDLSDKHSSASSDDVLKDDLKKIEGIGPFFESLLNKAGITTFEQLKNTDRDTLKEIIDAAGPDYRMHEPETWPYQAGLADRGDWKKLQDYIQFMTGRN